MPRRVIVSFASCVLLRTYADLAAPGMFVKLLHGCKAAAWLQHHACSHMHIATHLQPAVYSLDTVFLLCAAG